MKDNKALREALKTITERHHRYNNGLQKQIEEIERLKKVYLHNIELVEFTKTEDKCICYDYALRLSLAMASRCNKNSKGFILELKKNQSIIENVNGSLALYYDDWALKHAGTKEGDFIVSKWGGGHIWRHRPQEVPIQYGDIVKYYDICISGEEMENKFKEYCVKESSNI